MENLKAKYVELIFKFSISYKYIFVCVAFILISAAALIDAVIVGRFIYIPIAGVAGYISFLAYKKALELTRA